ncbi:MAG: SpoIVB peptidase [Clostridia bacterium]|nr:SpoIVB peptidase [Clostridia bacterium]
MRCNLFKTLKKSFKSVAARTAAVFAAFALTAFNYGGLMSGLRALPEAYYAENETELIDKLDNFASFGAPAVMAASSSDESIGNRAVEYRLFGLIPVKTVPAYVGARPELIPGGQAVGISIFTEGVLVVGTGEFTGESGTGVSPASKAGIKPGDVILSVGGKGVSTSAELAELLENCSGSAEMVIERDGKRLCVTVRPEKDPDGEFRIGAWVRDSTIGIGTLSFYDTVSGASAALGHPVLDADTGSLLKVKDGKLVIAGILGVTKGVQGSPGELHGTFGEYSTVIGSIEKNTALGIFGSLLPEAAAYLGGESIRTAFPDEVREGEAVILSAASGEVVEYSCRIIKTGRQNEPAPKGMVIEITDSRLIELTGGIVQGMSGSPVIQDGKLVGAVTHVFVNDPQKGYGAYAYWMYKEFGGRYG